MNCTTNLLSEGVPAAVWQATSTESGIGVPGRTLPLRKPTSSQRLLVVWWAVTWTVPALVAIRPVPRPPSVTV